MALSNVSASFSLCIHDVSCPRTPYLSHSRTSNFPSAASFLRGSLLVRQTSSHPMNTMHRARSMSVRCEQSAKGGSGLDVWLGRLGMIGFAVAISLEVATGKGLLENFGLTTPLPTVALAVTALVGVLTAIFIFQSASED